MTAKQLARQLGIQPASVAKRFASAMYKLGVNRQSALVAEAIKCQLISPLCIVLAGLLTVHILIGNQPVRQDRHIPSRRPYFVQIVRRLETFPILA